MSPWLYLCFLCVPPMATGLLEELYIREEVVKSISDVWMLKDDGPSYQRQLQEKLRSIPDQLSAAEDKQSMVEVLRFINSIPNQVKDEMQMNQLLEAMIQMDRVEATFEDYQKAGLLDQFILKNKLKKENDKIMKFLDSIISNDHRSVRVNMENIHRLVAGDTKILVVRSGLFFKFLDYLKKTDASLCKLEMSSHQLLSSLFSNLQMALLKAYSMMQFSWLMLNLYSKGNLTELAEEFRTNYKRRLYQQTEAFTETMKSADCGLWRCDPKIHEEGTTYTQLTKFRQGIFLNEAEINEENSCSKDCSIYLSTKQFYKDISKPSCDGKVVNCQSVDSKIQFCDAPDDSPRKYDWVKCENWTVGSKKSCQNSITKLSSYHKWFFTKCHLCLCYCDGLKGSVRYFNLRETMSDMANNRVVTGVRFVKENNIIHLKIQQGELMPFGRINATTIEWKPVEIYGINESNIKQYTDYHMLKNRERKMDLFNVEWLNNGRIVTGVKLDLVSGHLYLRVAFSEFSFAEGKLLRPGDYLFKPRKITLSSARSQLRWKKRDIPTRTAGFSRIDSSIDQSVLFGPTDLELDAGQTTVPFLDIQEVAPYPPVPLAGIGLYHKGAGDSVGFIGPRVLTFDFSYQILMDFQN